MTDGNPAGKMDRLGQRVFFHRDFKGASSNVCPSMVRGIDYIRDPRLNKVNFILSIHAFCSKNNFFIHKSGHGIYVG